MNGEEALNKLMKSMGCNSICNNMNYDRESYKVVLRNLKVLEALRIFFNENITKRIVRDDNVNGSGVRGEEIKVDRNNVWERDISIGQTSLRDIILSNIDRTKGEEIARMLCEWLDEPTIEDEARGNCIRHVINFKWIE